ncbi:MAG: phage holin family protein [Bacteroidetes bacterium]|nr:phage holin family protein [Bacteroidota bacterium]
MNTEPHQEEQSRMPVDADMGDLLSSALDDGKAYFKAQTDYYKLQTSEQLGKAAGSLASLLIISVLAVLIVICSSIAFAIWLGTLVHSQALGFLMVAGVYLLTLLLFILAGGTSLRRSITLKVINSLYHGQD